MYIVQFVLISQPVYCFDFLKPSGKGLTPVLLILKSSLWLLGPKIRRERSVHCWLLRIIFSFE